MQLSLLQSSGGPSYYIRAWLYGSAWYPYQAWLHRQLQSWQHGQKNLILVGPSGGWSLPTPFLQSFDKVIAYDIDPFAKTIFQIRHRLTSLEWHQLDFFGDGYGSLLPERRSSTHAMLFCNVLGQTGVVYKNIWQKTPAAEQQFILNLKELLKTQGSWASFHDVYSVEHRAPLKTISQTFFDLPDFVAQTGIQKTFIDHLTRRYFAQEHEALQLWRLSPRKAHLIGWQSRVI